jgi:hypothetical protein
MRVMSFVVFIQRAKAGRDGEVSVAGIVLIGISRLALCALPGNYLQFIAIDGILSCNFHR